MEELEALMVLWAKLSEGRTFALSVGADGLWTVTLDSAGVLHDDTLPAVYEMLAQHLKSEQASQIERMERQLEQLTHNLEALRAR